MPSEAQPKATTAPAVSSHDRILHAAKQLFARRGYENTSTVAIARLAGTSESQLMKHFGSKEGLLEAIFERGWRDLHLHIRRVQELPLAAVKLRGLFDLFVKGLNADPELKELMLLEGRRIRKEGNMILMTSGFIDFVRVLDGVMEELRAAGKLRPGIHPQAMRSAMVGMFEGLLRDQLLAQRVNYPAAYSTDDISALFDQALACFLTDEAMREAQRR